MEDQRVLFETAKLAKEKGFPQGGCRGWYNRIGTFLGQTSIKEDGTVVYYGMDAYQPSTSVKVTKEEYDECITHSWGAPTQSTLQRWLRDIKFIEVEPRYHGDYVGRSCSIISTKKEFHSLMVISGDSLSFEDILELGLQKALKQIK